MPTYLNYKYFFFHFELRSDPDPIFFQQSRIQGKKSDPHPCLNVCHKRMFTHELHFQYTTNKSINYFDSGCWVEYIQQQSGCGRCCGHGERPARGQMCVEVRIHTLDSTARLRLSGSTISKINNPNTCNLKCRRGKKEGRKERRRKLHQKKDERNRII